MAFVDGAVASVDSLDRATFVGLMFTSHAHLVLAAFAGRAGWRMGKSSVTGEAILTSSPWRALAWTTAAAVVPGVVVFRLRPVLTFAIRSTFVPWMYGRAEAGAEHERELLRGV